jgi:hypothetical protein
MTAVSPKERAAAKVRREKMILAVGSVVLLAVLGFELPKMLSRGGAPTAAPALPTAPSVSGSPLAAASGTLPNTDRVVVQHDPGQLLSFGLFKSKDPFVQQLGTTPAPASAPPPASTRQITTTTTPNGTPPSVIPPTTTSATPVTTSTLGTTPLTPPSPSTPPTAAAIATNGTCETVALNGTFPGTQGIFRVVWIARNGASVKIAVVGGAFDSGQPTATLELGQKLTLVNTADGTRYVIALEKKCAVQTQTAPAGTTSTTPPVTTTAAPAPVPTVTTPIVTDSVDTTTPSG